MPKRMTRIVPRKVDVEGAIAIVGVNIRRLRLGHNMSQETMAELAGISWRHYQKIEHARSNATVPSLVRIAAALDVDVGELFALPPAPSRSPAPAPTEPPASSEDVEITRDAGPDEPHGSA